MARLKLRFDKIIENIDILSDFMESNGKEWSLVVKVLGNNTTVLRKILTHPAVKRPHSIAVSQWSILKTIKEIDPTLRTMFIKPPSIKNADNIVRYADVSFNSSLLAIKALNEAAKKQDKIHEIIVMIEMGELREGIQREGLIPFYQNAFNLPNIKVIGLGTNLGCMMGIRPTYDKLIQLVLYKQLIEAKFKQDLELVSGASSITLPLLQKNTIPSGVNHFRIGEAVFLGTTPLNNKSLLNLHTSAFTFEASIVELYRKATQPDGIIVDSAVGGSDHNLASNEENSTTCKAVLDFGVLDVDADYLIPEDPSIHLVGNSSDLTVYDLGENRNNYDTGDVIRFNLKYLALAKLMHSQFVEIEIV
ncbi:MAG: alanine racemase [Candidatus Cloacimonetes bacterium]|nr:alanine racemase [Candidatus Cloacimonadota bacterium]